MTVKVLEYLKRRAVDDSTRSFPLLPVILCVTANAEPDLVSSVVSCGGADVILYEPISARALFKTALSLLSRASSVQSVYADIHKFKESRKYTYLPLFDKNRREAGRGDSVADDLEDGSSVGSGGGSAGHEGSGGGRLLEDDESGAESDIDSWSDSSDVVEAFLKERREDRQFQRFRSKERAMDPKDRSTFDSQLLDSLERARYAYTCCMSVCRPVS
jgi:hypothetical protein